MPAVVKTVAEAVGAQHRIGVHNDAVSHDGAIVEDGIRVEGNVVAQVTEPTDRYAAVDGRIEDLESNAPGSLIPLVSDNWTKVFKWHGTDPLPDDERHHLKQIVEKAHAQGRKVRFWATPDKPEVWAALFDAGVDLINTDDLAGLQKFLLSQPRK